jgi:glutathione S-transferase
VLQIWGRLSSLNVRKVVWTARELGVPFEHINAGRQFGVVDTVEYRRMNPNGLVPLLVDEGYRLWESNVIVRYLGARYGFGSFYPEALPERFDAERWMDWQQTTLNPASRDAFVQLIRTPPNERDAGRVQRSVDATEPLLALLDDQLSRRRYMAGERLTVADVPLACEVHRWWGLPRTRVARPHLERWYQSIREREASTGVLDVELT